MFSFTFLCKFSGICNFGIFDRIFMKFSPKLFWEVFAHFWIGKGPLFSPKSSLGKSLDWFWFIYYQGVLFQLESLQGEAETLEDEKPDEAAAIREKIAEINNVWVNLKDMVSRKKRSVSQPIF